MSNTIYTIALSTVDESLSGINLRLINEKGDIQFAFLPKEACGVIRPDMNPKEELEKFAEVLKGRKVNLVQQES